MGLLVIFLSKKYILISSENYEFKRWNPLFEGVSMFLKIKNEYKNQWVIKPWQF